MNIRIGFTPRVAALVDDLTDVSKPEDEPSDKKGARSPTHSKASPDAKTVKLILSATAEHYQDDLTLRRFL